MVIDHTFRHPRRAGGKQIFCDSVVINGDFGPGKLVSCGSSQEIHDGGCRKPRRYLAARDDLNIVDVQSVQRRRKRFKWCCVEQGRTHQFKHVFELAEVLAQVGHGALALVAGDTGARGTPQRYPASISRA